MLLEPGLSTPNVYCSLIFTTASSLCYCIILSIICSNMTVIVFLFLLFYYSSNICILILSVAFLVMKINQFLFCLLLFLFKCRGTVNFFDKLHNHVILPKILLVKHPMLPKNPQMLSPLGIFIFLPLHTYFHYVIKTLNSQWIF